jgi:hypothetical protein
VVRPLSRRIDRTLRACRAPAGCGGYISSTVGVHDLAGRLPAYPSALRCVCLLLQDLVQNCLHGGGGGYGRTCATRDDEPRPCVYLLLQYLIQICSRGGRRIVEDMCYEIRRAEACVRPVWIIPSRTSERGGEGDCVKGGGGEEGKCERERALERLRYYNPGH